MNIERWEIWLLVLFCCCIFSKLFQLSGPQFPHLNLISLNFQKFYFLCLDVNIYIFKYFLSTEIIILFQFNNLKSCLKDSKNKELQSHALRFMKTYQLLSMKENRSALSQSLPAYFTLYLPYIYYIYPRNNFCLLSCSQVSEWLATNYCF